jgi:putative Mg2+ transporter-C (MgtC) family protein
MLSNFEFIIRLLLAAGFGGVIGIEREFFKKPAGLRTHMLVSLGSGLFTILSFEGFPGSDPSRIASYIVVGIGFIGAGTIIQSRDRVVGITTAASLWIAAGVGMAVAVGYYLEGVVIAILSLLILRFGRIERRRKRKRKLREYLR